MCVCVCVCVFLEREVVGWGESREVCMSQSGSCAHKKAMLYINVLLGENISYFKDRTENPEECFMYRAACCQWSLSYPVIWTIWIAVACVSSVCVFVCVWLCVCGCVCVYVDMCVCVYLCGYICIMGVCTCVYVNMFMWVWKCDNSTRMCVNCVVWVWVDVIVCVCVNLCMFMRMGVWYSTVCVCVCMNVCVWLPGCELETRERC